MQWEEGETIGDALRHGGRYEEPFDTAGATEISVVFGWDFVLFVKRARERVGT